MAIISRKYTVLIRRLKYTFISAVAFQTRQLMGLEYTQCRSFYLSLVYLRYQISSINIWLLMTTIQQLCVLMFSK